MSIRLSEHKSITIKCEEAEGIAVNKNEYLYVDKDSFISFLAIESKEFKPGIHKFAVKKADGKISISADYCIGLDWLGKTERYVYVEPKLNKVDTKHFVQCADVLEEDVEAINKLEITLDDAKEESKELNYIEMLLDVMSVDATAHAATALIEIEWNAKHISIMQEDDKLTPFLIVQYLQLLKSIVKKGLKKSYYKVQENLTNKIKGKIRVGQHIKQNVFKNRFTQTYCEYQVFGDDSTENKFLNKVFGFAKSYVENNKAVFNGNTTALAELISYCNPSFEHIGNEMPEFELKHIYSNPFFKEYKHAIQIGQYILKRFSYNITQTSQKEIATPPFWINMPELFELYVYAKMLKDNSLRTKDIQYQFSTYGNALDILVTDEKHPMVIDAKYKLHYKHGQIHQDIRQVSGYARLRKVLKEVGIMEDDGTLKVVNGVTKEQVVDCLIIYPEIENGVKVLSFANIFSQRVEVKAYYRVYKLGIHIPMVGEKKD